MTEIINPEPRSLPTPTAAEGLQRFMPADIKQLVWLAGEVAKSGFYMKSVPAERGYQVPMNGSEVFMVMEMGVELGLHPLQAMENIYLTEDKHGRKTRLPRADLIGARIQADTRCEEWDPVDPADAPPGEGIVRARRKGRALEVRVTSEQVGDDVVKRWLKGGQDVNSMLLNRAIRKMARLHFKDVVLGLDLSGPDHGERQVIDVVGVQRDAGDAEEDCPKCGNPMGLKAPAGGGAYMECGRCGHRSGPPQHIRDAIRGHKDVPRLEPGERTLHEAHPDSIALVDPESQAEGGGTRGSTARDTSPDVVVDPADAPPPGGAAEEEASGDVMAGGGVGKDSPAPPSSPGGDSDDYQAALQLLTDLGGAARVALIQRVGAPLVGLVEWLKQGDNAGKILEEARKS